MNFGYIFEFIYTKLGDLFFLSRGHGTLNDEPNDENLHPERRSRTPYPPDGPIEVLPPINQKEVASKRQAVDKEFWETL